MTVSTRVERHTFQYFWAGAEPHSGLARERIHTDGVYPQHDQEVVTSGGSGFGLMGILVGTERGFISRDQGLERLEKVVRLAPLVGGSERQGQALRNQR